MKKLRAQPPTIRPATPVMLPPIRSVAIQQAGETLQQAACDLRVDILTSCYDFTVRTGLVVKELRISHVKGQYDLGITIRLKQGEPA
jgi:hypothetical protein